MTQRKPSESSFETWIDGQIREAAERGEFDELRAVLAEVNERIREAIRGPLPGSALDLAPIDVDGALAAWRRERPPA